MDPVRFEGLHCVMMKNNLFRQWMHDVAFYEARRF